MRSRVIHPNIPADDYYNIEVGAQEGSVLSPILLLVAIEDMQEYLAAHPFQQRATVSTKHAKRQRQKGKPPGVRIGGTYLALLQHVDDAVLLAHTPSSPARCGGPSLRAGWRPEGRGQAGGRTRLVRTECRGGPSCVSASGGPPTVSCASKDAHRPPLGHGRRALGR